MVRGALTVKRRFSTKRRTFTENNLISAAALIWVFLNKFPIFVTALDDLKRYQNHIEADEDIDID